MSVPSTLDCNLIDLNKKTDFYILFLPSMFPFKFSPDLSCLFSVRTVRVLLRGASSFGRWFPSIFAVSATPSCLSINFSGAGFRSELRPGLVSVLAPWARCSFSLGSALGDLFWCCRDFFFRLDFGGISPFLLIFFVSCSIWFFSWRLGMAIRVRVPDIHRVPDPMGIDTGMIFYPRVALVPDLNWDEYETGIFFHLRIIWRVPDTLLPL
jgi:hypothetical protein